jgi:hypothetical protein
MGLFSLRNVHGQDGELFPLGSRVAAIILLMITLSVITVCLSELFPLFYIYEELS